MRFSIVFLLTLPSLIQGLGSSKFVSPTYQTTTSTVKYSANSRWPLGSTQIVAFTTSWEEYRVELWQQKQAGGATLSSQFNYAQKDGEEFPQSFQWTVQTYELQLSRFPVFFFWLINNNNSSQQQASAYFNITIEDSTPSASASTSSEPTTSSSLMPSRFSTITTTTSHIISSSVSKSSTLSTSTSTPVSNFTESAAASRGLSAGAVAGIAVGVSLGGLLILGIAALVWFKKRRRRTALQATPPTALPAAPPTDPYPHPELPGTQKIYYAYEPPRYTMPTSHYYTPKPAGAPYHYQCDSLPAELGN
ncbi:hypothetical protein F4808DRAFT_24190 [Astrocystis sublimbata]|nr:hypothetical protein F4808DRAFT_24190 [Astrocystis sublimbata]